MGSMAPPAPPMEFNEDVAALESAQAALANALLRLRTQQLAQEQQQQVLEQLRIENAKLRDERDIYLNSLYTLTRDEAPIFTAEEIKHLQEFGVSWEEVVARLELT